MTKAPPTPLRVLQVGGGSMGTRRLRDLSARDDVTLALLDARPDRREAAETRWQIPTFATLHEALAWRPDALSISTPPDQHQPYIDAALAHGLHHFSEANIWVHDHPAVCAAAQRQGLQACISHSFAFLPVVEALQAIVRTALGRVHAWQMTLSTYMPTWHPGEGAEYYARRRATCAAREMVPFEMTWLADLFGMPEHVTGHVARCGSLPYDTEDTWSLQMTLPSRGVGQLTVLMGCPTLRRAGIVLGERGQVRFDLTAGTIDVELEGYDGPTHQTHGEQAAVLEAAYRREIHTFIDAVRGAAVWPLDYARGAQVTAVLAAAERSAATGRWQPVDADRQPEPLPGCAAVVG